ncbi:LacI family DNA-binding transcriptional regulator [Spongisporangium articulatum]|uniref:LacI family DNA-binding transcriptional regulator n=1 Tax=Spongisporangium articulatum TaxID=3362603 RepID=A0ABW8AP75_9ACTN
MTTIRDVALRAQVSTATVSRALSADTRVAPETLSRVLAAARELNYVPNTVARSLRQQRSMTWALIIADVENPFLTQLTRGVEDVAQSAGYSVLLCNSDESPDKEDSYLALAIESRVTGVLITPTSPDTDIEGLIARDLPVIAMDRPLHHSKQVDTVLVDTRRAARAAVEGLADAGFRRIGCLTGPRRVFTAEERAVGYREGLADAGLVGSAGADELIRYADYNVAGGRAAAESLLDDTEVDAILVANSLMTVGLLEVMSERELSAGKDIHVTTFDDAPWTRLLGAQIAVLPQPAYDVGKAAAQMLLARLEHPESPARTVMLNVDLGAGRPTPR